jgi:hypothetical protein
MFKGCFFSFETFLSLPAAEVPDFTRLDAFCRDMAHVFIVVCRADLAEVCHWGRTIPWAAVPVMRQVEPMMFPFAAAFRLGVY